MVLLITMAFMVITAPAVSALAIQVDGNLEDWGLAGLSGPASDWSSNTTWIPTNPGVSFIVSDNNNPLHAGYPGYYAPGVHITGSPANWQFYDEPLGTLASDGKRVNVPWGGKPYNVAALYLAQDNDTVYIAAITSVPPEGFNASPSEPVTTPSDLAMHFSPTPAAKMGYEYGIRLGSPTDGENFTPGDIVYLPDWQNQEYILPAAPNVMRSPPLPGGGIVGHARIAYNRSWINHADQGVPQYVIELSFPKSAVGMAGSPVDLSNFMLTQKSKNARFFVPAFPALAVSFGAVLGMTFTVYVVRRKDL